MSFAEFQIRLFAWKRMEDREWEKVRIISWYSMIGSHLNPKRLPSSIQNFMSLDIDKKQNTITDAVKQRFIDEMAKYVKQKNEWQA